MPAALTLTDEDRQLVADYKASLRQAGMSTIPTKLWPAKAFCARVGGIAGWSALTVDEQRNADRRIRSFVNWLIVTGRIVPSAEYVVATAPQLGRSAARLFPAIHALIAETATDLGYSAGMAVDQWSLLARLAAVAGIAPDQLTSAGLESARCAIAHAENRLSPRGRFGRQSMTRPSPACSPSCSTPVSSTTSLITAPRGTRRRGPNRSGPGSRLSLRRP